MKPRPIIKLTNKRDCECLFRELYRIGGTFWGFVNVDDAWRAYNGNIWYDTDETDHQFIVIGFDMHDRLAICPTRADKIGTFRNGITLVNSINHYVAYTKMLINSKKRGIE